MSGLATFLSKHDLAGARTYLSEHILPKAIASVNDRFSPERLQKLERSAEPLPTEQRQLSSYRTRLGTMLEYALSTAIDEVLQETENRGSHLCFVSYHDYPDFVLRDGEHRISCRIEMKCVESRSDEQAARFDAPTVRINPNQDLLLLIAWEWRAESPHGVSIEYPWIFASALLRANVIAEERDRRLRSRGGKIEHEKVMVPSHKYRGRMVPDPGNYGKLWRILPRERMDLPDLPADVAALRDFLRKIQAKMDEHAAAISEEMGS